MSDAAWMLFLALGAAILARVVWDVLVNFRVANPVKSEGDDYVAPVVSIAGSGTAVLAETSVGSTKMIEDSHREELNSELFRLESWGVDNKKYLIMLLLAAYAIEKLEETAGAHDLFLKFHASQIREGCYWACKGRPELKEVIDRVARSGVAKLAILEGKQQDDPSVPELAARFNGDLTALRQTLGDAATK
jgi:hypothetical protein